MNGTYVFNTNPTAPTEYPFTETVPYKYGSSSGGTYQSIRFYQDTNTKNLCMYYHYSDTSATAVYNFTTKKWLNDTYKTIIFDNQTVSESFYDWFIANTTLSSSATKTLSGTWTFNDTVNAPSTTLQQSINFTAYNKSMIYIKATPDPFTIVYGETASTNHVVYNTTSKWNYSIAGLQKVTFTSEQEVSDEFYEWFTANATGGGLSQ